MGDLLDMEARRRVLDAIAAEEGLTDEVVAMILADLEDDMEPLSEERVVAYVKRATRRRS